MSLKNPQNPLIDAGLLLLRLGAGLSLLVFFGLPKLRDAGAFLRTGQWMFVDFNRRVGLPLPVFVAFLQTLNESLGAFLVAGGLVTRYAAFSVGFGFAVAAYCSIKMSEPAWMLAAYYSLMFLTLALTGAGRFSLDHLWQSRTAPAVAAEPARNEA
jgi:putative oxidoreductase